MNTFNHIEVPSWENKMKDSINKIRNLIVAGLLGIGVSASETAEGAITITIPTKTSGSGLEQNTTDEGKSNIWSSRTISNGAVAETISEMKISVSAADAGLNGGILTISGFMRMVTGVSSPTVWQWYANTTADVNQEIRWWIVGQSMTTLKTFNGPEFLNNSNREFNWPGEWFDVNQPFSFDINVPAGGIEYTLQNVAQAFNADATVRLSGDISGSLPINYSFTQIPEPDISLLTGATATLALLRRKRK